MTAIVYNVPLTIVAQDNKTDIVKTTILVKDCSAFGNPNAGCEGWNFNHCPNDNDYCQPVVKGDIIYGQFKHDILHYTLTKWELINSKTGENLFDYYIFTRRFGRDTTGTAITNYKINTSMFDVSCWYVKATLMPKGGGDNVYFTSEPYCTTVCETDTVLIQGHYPNGYDCDGNYYGFLSGFLGGASTYIPSFRIPGELLPDGFDLEKTSNLKKIVKSQQTERFLLMTQKIPYYVAKQIAVCFNSEKCLIDGQEYTGTIKLNKNFEEGKMWIIKENVYIKCDEINFTCD